MQKGSRCWCCALLGIFVIVLAWWHVSWAPYALTAAGAIIALKEITGFCCCCKTKGEGGSCC